MLQCVAVVSNSKYKSKCGFLMVAVIVGGIMESH